MDYQRYLTRLRHRSAVALPKTSERWVRALRTLRTPAFLAIVLSIGFFAGFLFVSLAFADDALPNPQSLGLPFEGSDSHNDVARSISQIIREIVKYVGVLAVLALTYGGFLFMTSFSEDEKVKKAKAIVQYSLIGVILSVAAYSIIDIVNELRL